MREKMRMTTLSSTGNSGKLQSIRIFEWFQGIFAVLPVYKVWEGYEEEKIEKEEKDGESRRWNGLNVTHIFGWVCWCGDGETENTAKKFMWTNEEAGWEKEGKDECSIRVVAFSRHQMLNQCLQCPWHQIWVLVHQSLLKFKEASYTSETLVKSTFKKTDAHITSHQIPHST